eukprot:CAMPEP_0204904118 /NCGR_PEP_ID=MMETSP1397-20131031/4675_1 /ASSEMBLY_ACC=CAM_ASM_000891 /TAXON_ID=49980 /ORGANISM="Climacostomum Climacostomum virens, Strain Stock W-24" /LENGTH=42 /DNA_ID= /DNA_START= /DNA_END= /DNA_ORIENTATION=
MSEVFELEVADVYVLDAGDVGLKSIEAFCGQGLPKLEHLALF